MRWPQFLLTLINLGYSLYLILANVFLTDNIDPNIFLWTLIYAALALAIAHLYMLYMSNKIDDWYDVESMRSIGNLSICSLAICSLALVGHFALLYYNKKPIPKDIESIKRLVPLIAALLCSLVLFTSSIKFKKYIILCRSVDLQAATVAAQKKNYQTTSS